MFGGYARYRHYAMNERWLRPYRMVPEPLRALIRDQVATTPLLNSTAAPQTAAHLRRPRRRSGIALPG